MNMPYQAQCQQLMNELYKAFDYIEIMEARKAQFDIKNGNWNEQNLLDFLLFSSYAGSLVRIAYYKYVYQRGFDVRALMEAVVRVYMFQRIFWFDLEDKIKDPLFQAVLQQTRYPKWTKFGLIGGSTQELVKLGEEFSVYMKGLTEQEELA